VPDSFVDQLPKAELHVHLEGTLEPEMMLRLATRNAVELPWSSVDELRAAYSFTGLEHFLSLYFRGCQVLHRRADFYELTLAYLERAAAQGVARAEMFFGPQTFLDVGIAMADQLNGILAAIADARQHWSIDGALLISAQRHRSEADALELLELVQPWSSSIAGFGLGSAERGNPPAKFQNYFAACRAAGFPTTIHAGEDGPADYVRQALDLCQVDRIDHGVAAATDTDLVARLRDERVPLTMCPLSNRQLGVVDDLSQHPLRQLYDAGVLVTVNSDDPPYFGGYVNENYTAVQEHLGFGPDELAALAANSFTASFADDAAIAHSLAAVGRHAHSANMP
jgi:adenosine deaminase